MTSIEEKNSVAPLEPHPPTGQNAAWSEAEMLPPGAAPAAPASLDNDPIDSDPYPRPQPHIFKMRLSNEDYTWLKNHAHEHQISMADFARFQIFGGTSYRLPSALTLQTICQKLAGIANNLNQCQKVINQSFKTGKINADVCQEMFYAIASGKKIWAEPLEDMREEIAMLKPRK
jgi:hypothetical protein